MGTIFASFKDKKWEWPLRSIRYCLGLGPSGRCPGRMWRSRISWNYITITSRTAAPCLAHPITVGSACWLQWLARSPLNYPEFSHPAIHKHPFPPWWNYGIDHQWSISTSSCHFGQCSQCKMQKELWKYLHSLFQCSDVDLLKEISVELNFLGNLKQKCCCQFCLGSCLGLFAHIIILDLERQHCRRPLHFNMRTKNRGRGTENDICLY